MFKLINNIYNFVLNNILYLFNNKFSDVFLLIIIFFILSIIINIILLIFKNFIFFLNNIFIIK